MPLMNSTETDCTTKCRSCQMNGFLDWWTEFFCKESLAEVLYKLSENLENFGLDKTARQGAFYAYICSTVGTALAVYADLKGYDGLEYLDDEQFDMLWENLDVQIKEYVLKETFPVARAGRGDA